MTIRFDRAAVEPIDWRAREPCPHCRPFGGSRKISHLGVGYGFSMKRDGTEAPVRIVLAQGCEWHMRMWSRGRLRTP